MAAAWKGVFCWAHHKEQWDKPVRDSLEMAQLEEYESGMKWLPACKDVSPRAEEHPLMEDVTQQRSEQ